MHLYTHFSSWPNRKKMKQKSLGILCDLLTIPCGVVITKNYAYKVPWILSVIPSMRGDYGLQSWLLWCSGTGSYSFSSLFPWTGAWPLSASGWFFSNASFSLFLNYSCKQNLTAFPSWVFLGHQAKCHTRKALYNWHTQPCSNHMLYHYDLFMDSKTAHSL